MSKCDFGVSQVAPMLEKSRVATKSKRTPISLHDSGIVWLCQFWRDFGKPEIQEEGIGNIGARPRLLK